MPLEQSRASPKLIPKDGPTLGFDIKLLAFAYSFEQASGLRKPPKSTPPLPNEP
jgi:hypothetical protein